MDLALRTSRGLTFLSLDEFGKSPVLNSVWELHWIRDIGHLCLQAEEGEAMEEEAWRKHLTTQHHDLGVNESEAHGPHHLGWI